MIGSQRILTGSRWTGSPSTVVSSTPCAVTTAMSLSSRITTSRVCARMAGMSEAMNISPRPKPTTPRPARVAEAERARDGLLAQHALGGLQAARRGPHLQAVRVEHGHARGIVAAVLQPPEPVHDDRDRVFVADVTDDAAHTLAVLFRLARPLRAVAGAPPGGPPPLCHLLVALDAHGVRGPVLRER